jgi:CBS domain-containing protein
MPLRARDVMQTGVITIDADASLLDAHRLFIESEITGAPVVDDAGTVVGVISSADLLRAVEEERDTALADRNYFRDLTEFSGPDWSSDVEDFQDRLAARTVADAMTPEAISVDAEVPVSEVARTMRTQRVHRVLVEEDRKLVGLISAFDLVALLEKDPPGR